MSGRENQNQCDGCMAGKPLIDGQYHRMGSDAPGAYLDLMVCTKGKYTGESMTSERFAELKHLLESDDPQFIKAAPELFVELERLTKLTSGDWKDWSEAGAIAESIRKPPMGDAEKRALLAAVVWFESRRPPGWSEDQHLRNPTVNMGKSSDKLLAISIAAMLNEND